MLFSFNLESSYNNRVFLPIDNQVWILVIIKPFFEPFFHHTNKKRCRTMNAITKTFTVYSNIFYLIEKMSFVRFFYNTIKIIYALEINLIAMMIIVNWMYVYKYLWYAITKWSTKISLFQRYITYEIEKKKIHWSCKSIRECRLFEICQLTNSIVLQLATKYATKSEKII